MCSWIKLFVGAFAKCCNAVVSFVMSAPVRVKQLGSYWTGFYEV